MTNDANDLIAALEADIHQWESEAEYFANSVGEILIGGKDISARDYADVLRQRIAEYRALIEKVRTG